MISALVSGREVRESEVDTDSLVGIGHADTESNPFARSNNVTFNGTPWTRDISHGEMISDGNDQTLTIDPCRLRYLCQGMDPAASGPYNTLPWRLALLTQTNSPC